MNTNHNEPAIRIRGGSTRASKRIPRCELPALSVRERVQAALQAHDPDTRDREAASFGASERALLRLIATEGAITNIEPALRYDAISALVRPCDADSWNLLVDLAHFGEDFYVRGHALLALGASGISLALPAIARGLRSTESFERSCAKKAVASLARETSPESVRAYAALLDAESRLEIERILVDRTRPVRREPRETPSWKRQKSE